MAGKLLIAVLILVGVFLFGTCSSANQRAMGTDAADPPLVLFLLAVVALGIAVWRVSRYAVGRRSVLILLAAATLVAGLWGTAVVGVEQGRMNEATRSVLFAAMLVLAAFTIWRVVMLRPASVLPPALHPTSPNPPA